MYRDRPPLLKPITVVPSEERSSSLAWPFVTHTWPVAPVSALVWNVFELLPGSRSVFSFTSAETPVTCLPLRECWIADDSDRFGGPPFPRVNANAVTLAAPRNTAARTSQPTSRVIFVPFGV